MAKTKPLLIQAPTGLGKTIGVLYPTLKEALSRGQKTIYLTPKNSQHMIARDAILKLQAKAAKLRSLTIHSKKKLCLKAEPICNPEYCEYAESHYTKVEENKLLPKLKKYKNLSSKNFKDLGQQYSVCPYELQMECLPSVDAIICDYNYVFSPAALTSRVGKLQLAETEKPNLVIDEIHNLPARGMDYYSYGLSCFYLKKLAGSLPTLEPELNTLAQTSIRKCIELIMSYSSADSEQPRLIKIALAGFKQQESDLNELLVKYLESNAVIKNNDPILTLYNYWFDFTSALEFATSDNEAFFTSYNPSDRSIKITCCDASELLQASYVHFKQVIGFSATLKPFAYYSQLSGLSSAKLTTKEFPSPFPKEKRKIVIIPQVSSKYLDRAQNYSKIVEVIQRISLIKRGNYFIFFPSFDFLDAVYELYKPDAASQIVRQTRGMKLDEANLALERLKQKEVAHLFFAVQGGIFAEGIDYHGDLAIGAFIVGPPLPSYNWEREQMKTYYEEQYTKGADYAYIYPAMAKAIQAAGRVIRSETDKGIIILMDNRFLKESYYKCMPQDWFAEDPVELISQAILKDIHTFWNES